MMSAGSCTSRPFSRRRRPGGDRRLPPAERAGASIGMPSGGASDAHRGADFVLLLRDELLERLQRRIQLAGFGEVAVREERVGEITVRLEHVAHLVRAGETETAVGVRVDRVVL